jgi:hypothetical protein
MQEALVNAGVLIFQWPTLKVSGRFELDVIGEIRKATGEVETVEDPAAGTLEVPVTEPLEGYHANLRVLQALPVEDTDDEILLLSPEQAEALTPIMVDAPSVPYRVWA